MNKISDSTNGGDSVLTVVFVSDEFKERYAHYDLFTNVLFNKYNIALCSCDYSADNLISMVPDLYQLIEDVDQWRAVIVAPSNENKFNPFDFTGYSEINTSVPLDSNLMKERRQRRFANYEKAVKNPLLQLTTALCGTTYSKLLIDKEDYNMLVNGKISEFEYLLKRKLRDTNVKHETYRLNNTLRNQLEQLTGEEYADDVIEAILSRDSKSLIKLLNEERIIELMRLLGGFDSLYTDPETIDSDLCNYKKFEVFSTFEDDFLLNEKKPVEVRCVALRCFDTETYFNERKVGSSTFSAYSDFAENNLFHPSVLFFVYDIIQREDKRYETEVLKFLSFLIIFSANDIPNGFISGGFLYQLVCEYSDDGYTKTIENYLSRLYATHALLEQKIKDISEQRVCELDDFTAMQEFESSIVVPVSIRSSQSKEGLKAKLNVGLSKDCPDDEEIAWRRCYAIIKKNQVKYFREPKRAVKTAAKGPFRQNNKVSDERIRIMTEYQLEDIAFKLEEEERLMVETAIENTYDITEYNKKSEEAGNAITEITEKRMTKIKTISIGILTAVMFFIGFIPLFISQLNTIGSTAIGFYLIVGCLAAFLSGAVVSLFVFRYRLKSAIKKFNRLMDEICVMIDSNLMSFSKYLSHACNVMRKFSILAYDKKPENDTVAILTKHKIDVENKITQIVEKYPQLIDLDSTDNSAEPFRFDYSKPDSYDYDPDYSENNQQISFIAEYNRIFIPVEYLKSIIAVKEDLYG